VRTGCWMGPPQGKRAPRVGPICVVILAREGSVSLPSGKVYSHVQGYLAHAFEDLSAFERRGDNSKSVKDCYPHARADIWPWLSYMCHVSSTVVTCAARQEEAHNVWKAPSRISSSIQRILRQVYNVYEEKRQCIRRKKTTYTKKKDNVYEEKTQRTR